MCPLTLEAGPATTTSFPAARFSPLGHTLIPYLTRVPARALLLAMAGEPLIVDILDALTASRGNLSRAASSLNLSRSSLKTKIEREPQIVSHLDDIRQEMLDAAEDNLRSDIEKGDPSAGRFALSTIGKDRGYVQSVAGLGKDGAITVEIREFAPKE